MQLKLENFSEGDAGTVIRSNYRFLLEILFIRFPYDLNTSVTAGFSLDWMKQDQQPRLFFNDDILRISELPLTSY